MHMIWVNNGNSRHVPLLSIIFGLILLIFSPFIPGFIGILLAAAILIISLGIIAMGVSMKGTGFSLPLVLIGIVGGALSLYALLTPDVTVSFMGVILGFIIVLIGFSQLLFSPRFTQDRLSWFFLVTGGVVTILVGFYLILSPLEGMQLVMIFLGCYLIVYGIIGFFRKNRGPYAYNVRY